MNPLYSTATILRECGISARQLYYWEVIGLIQPRYENFGMRRFRRYTGDDVALIKQAKALLDEGFTLQAVRERLGEGGRWKAEGGKVMEKSNLPPSTLHLLPSHSNA